ncbi:ferrochelatase [Candidatus Colwellia aromaticivorans]|uniref:ferrochelatase n=1 Tax=Candidatus Colwellia aromaticivorans TaxID=2267621 RepID=UPI000DF4C207|nr:ferrochelatase [Candidatus Colwellia aromaticivorans]
MKSRFSAKKNSSKKNSSKQSSDYSHSAPKVGVLLTNLGSPAVPTTTAVRNYLREFLSDPRVVEIPRVIWMLILHGIVLRFRPKKSAKLYQSVWTEQGAPLLVISQAQQQKVAAQIKQQFGEDVIVDVAMRYGDPSISSVLQEFQQQGVDQLVVLPLYPQYAGPTTASTFDAVSKELQQWRYVPSLHFINSYHNNPLYIKALANSVSEHLSEHGIPDKLVLSYHGMPELFYQWGDPYFDFCQITTDLLKKELLARSLGLTDETFVMTFQSRFGKAKWLQPYTDETLATLAKEGNKHLAIISPAFSADCLETLEELECENREVFIQAGGEQYYYIAALNDRDDHISALVNILTPLMNKK